MSSIVSFIGLGQMGLPIARNLLKNNIKLHVYNRTPERAEPLLKEGASLLKTPREAFEKAPIVMSILANDHALEEISTGKNGLLETIKPGQIHVSLSTVAPKLVRHLTELHEAKGSRFVSATVFGRPDVAEAGKLWICCAGDKQAKAQIQPLLTHIGQKTYDFGDDPSQANLVKLIGNFMILTAIETMAEAFALASKGGVDTEALHTFLTDSLFPSPVFKNYGRILTKQNFEPAGFKLHLGLKDIDLTLRSAEALHIPMPIAGLLHDRLLTALANDRGNMDWSSIALCSFEDSGLQRELVHSEP